MITHLFTYVAFTNVSHSFRRDMDMWSLSFTLCHPICRQLNEKRSGFVPLDWWLSSGDAWRLHRSSNPIPWTFFQAPSESWLPQEPHSPYNLLRSKLSTRPSVLYAVANPCRILMSLSSILDTRTAKVCRRFSEHTWFTLPFSWRNQSRLVQRTR